MLKTTFFITEGLVAKNREDSFLLNVLKLSTNRILYHRMFGGKEWFGDSEPPLLLGKSLLKVTYCSNELNPRLKI